MDDEKLLLGRFRELSSRASSRDCIAYSEFLTLSEQSFLKTLKFDADVFLDGGTDYAERRIAVFRGKDCCYEEPSPIVCVMIRPVSAKYAEDLSHRDFLGSLIGLGIRREVLGDIIVFEKTGFLFCLDVISVFICRELTKVRHTDVECCLVEGPPENSVSLPPVSRIVVSSERLDAIVSAVFKISRSESQKLFSLCRVYVNGKTIESFTGSPASSDIISVRGLGRFIYEGVEYETKKGRLSASVRIFPR